MGQGPCRNNNGCHTDLTDLTDILCPTDFTDLTDFLGVAALRSSSLALLAKNV